MKWKWLDEVLPDAVVVMDERQRITQFNGAAERLWGHRAAEVMGRPLTTLLPERFVAAHGAHVDGYAARAEGARRMDRRMEVFARRRDGAEIPCEVSIARTRVGGAARFVAIVRDLTEQKRVRSGLAQAEATLRALFATSRDAIVLLDDSLTVRAHNEAASLLARAAGERLVDGEPLSACLGEATGDLLVQALHGRHSQQEQRLRTSPPRWVELSGSPVHLPSGVVAGLTLVCRDITGRRTADERARQDQKLELVGELAGGIAHDFRNLLTVITSAAASLRHELGPTHPSLRGVVDVESAATRAAALTGQLLAFAGLQPAEPRVVDVALALAALEQVLRRLLGKDLALHVHLEPGCFVCIDPTQLDQVLMNLAVNARDAMPAGGTLTLSTERRGGEGEVRVRVTDTGVGIDPAIRSRLFEPFFTTKSPGHGTGLGLATCYRVVSAAGGRIAVTSEPGKGACFELHLPLAPRLRSE